MANCPNCGAVLTPGAKFCGACGASISTAPAAAPAGGYTPPAPTTGSGYAPTGYSAPYGYSASPSVPAGAGTSGMMVTGMILSIAALLMSIIAWFWGGWVLSILGLILGIVGVILSAKGKNRSATGRGMGVAGLGCGIIAIVDCAIVIVVAIITLAAVSSVVNSGGFYRYY